MNSKILHSIQLQVPTAKKSCTTPLYKSLGVVAVGILGIYSNGYLQRMAFSNSRKRL